MQDERSQHQVGVWFRARLAIVDNPTQNKRRAFQVLAARLMDQKLTKEMAERRAVRQNLVKTADRSEKIRTYNYAQVRWEPLIRTSSARRPLNSRTGSPTTDLGFP